MAAGKLSPTAHLLRTSRLFSLPPPLPKPAQAFTATSTYDSPTATLPYPIHATIETTQSALSRGDWGLKRSLPLKSTTKTSTPLIRIGDVDSIDHITDFESAADHTITLRKWQEMAIPISRAPSNSGAIGRRGLTEPLRSVFESEFDNSVKEDGVGIARRWKFKGPWLASQTEGEFQEYTMKKINKRKLEFKQFLREHLAEKMSVSQRRASMEAGQEGVESVVVSDKDLQAYIMDLRRDTPSLHSLIERFLDLPNDMELPDRSFAEAGEEDPSKRGPPTTHPSAGLSYLRTSSHIHNHPILGPQAENQPFQGRVLMPYSNMRGRKRARLLIGVGGVAAVGDQVQFWQQHQHPGLATFDPDIPGGAKIWVHPLHAHIDPQGRIKLKVKKVEDNTLAIYEGIVDEEAVLPRVDTKNRDFPDSLSPAQSATRSTRGYGLESEGRVRSYSRAEPIPDTNTQDIVDMLKHGMRPGKP